MHEELTPNGAVALSEVQGAEQRCFYGDTIADEGDYIVVVGAFTFALSGVSRLMEELQELESASDPTAKKATLYLPLDESFENEWDAVDDGPAKTALEFGTETYNCAVCGGEQPHDDEGLYFIQYIWCHESCVDGLIGSLDSVWDHTDTMLEEYL